MSNFYKSKHKGRLIDKAVAYVLETLPTLLSSKVDKENGKGLTSNNFTDADKNKLERLENYDDAELKQSVAELEDMIAERTNELDINKEDKSNKVSVIDENSTDKQYPTSKAVYNNIIPTFNFAKRKTKNKYSWLENEDDTMYYTLDLILELPLICKITNKKNEVKDDGTIIIPPFGGYNYTYPYIDKNGDLIVSNTEELNPSVGDMIVITIPTNNNNTCYSQLLFKGGTVYERKIDINKETIPINSVPYLMNYFVFSQWDNIDSDYEDKNNKVNVIEEASDMTYPTTSAVCDYVGNRIADTTDIIFSNINSNENNISEIQDDLSNYKELNERNLNTLKNDLDEVNSTANYAHTIALGKNNANVYNNYTEFVDWIDSYGYNFTDLFDPIKTGRNTLEIGKNIYVRTLDIPDGWIMEAPESAVPFCENIKADAAAAGRTLDKHIKYLFETQGYFATKWVKVAALETQKVDLSEFYNKAEIDTTIEKVENKIDSIRNIVLNKKPLTWNDVQAIVRSGLASEYFNIGDQFVVEKVIDENTTIPLTFDVIGIDHDTPANPSYTHSMTLQLHDLWTSAMIFDAPEAASYIDEETYPNGLEAGTYHFTLPSGYDTAYGGGSAFNFTLTNTVPVGGQIRFGWSYNTQASACKITTYASVGTTTALETVSVVEGEAGTAMPSLHTTTVTENTNCVHRMRYGSNNWAESSLRQWLNTDADANSWWEAKTVFDRPANASSAGFLKGLDPEFISVIGEVTKTTQRSISDGYGLDTSAERFFLLSRPEIYAGTERSADGADGTVYEYYGDEYSDLTAPGTGADTNRIKYRNGSASYWWLRTPYSVYGHDVHPVHPSGALNNTSASNSIGVAPACVII